MLTTLRQLPTEYRAPPKSAKGAEMTLIGYAQSRRVCPRSSNIDASLADSRARRDQLSADPRCRRAGAGRAGDRITNSRST